MKGQADTSCPDYDQMNNIPNPQFVNRWLVGENIERRILLDILSWVHILSMWSGLGGPESPKYRVVGSILLTMMTMSGFY